MLADSNSFLSFQWPYVVPYYSSLVDIKVKAIGIVLLWQLKKTISLQDLWKYITLINDVKIIFNSKQQPYTHLYYMLSLVGDVIYSDISEKRIGCI